MDKQEKIKEIAKRIADCRGELESIRDDVCSSEWKKVRESLTSAISFLNRADKQITDLAPMEGQIDMFDWMSENDMER